MKQFSKAFKVDSKDTAKQVGSGELEVLATPALIAMVENTANSYVQTQLPSEETSVGSKINLKHLSPSPVGAQILVKMIVKEQKLSKIDFTFEVFQEEALIAVGEHQRVVVNKSSFFENL